MEAKIIGQGYKPSMGSSVAKTLMELIQDPTYNSITFISAFASPDSSIAFKKYINEAQSRGCQFRIIVGIDQNGTSKKALEALLSLNVQSYIYHVRFNNQSVIFHPKIYVFSNDERYSVIVGSNNFTSNGLTRNAECSVLVSGEKSDAFFNELNAYWGGLIDGTDSSLRPITQDFIDELYRLGYIPTESTRQKQQESASSQSLETTSSLSNPFATQEVQKWPDGYKVTARTSARRTSRPNPVIKAPVAMDSEDYDVLIAECPSNRWPQVSFHHKDFIDFFEVQEQIDSEGLKSYAGTKRFSYAGGGSRDSEPRSKGSSNYTFELRVSGVRKAYPQNGRPIGIYVKKDSTHFDFVILFPGDEQFDTVYQIIHEGNTSSARCPSMYMDYTELREVAPSLPFFIDKQ